MEIAYTIKNTKVSKSDQEYAEVKLVKIGEFDSVERIDVDYSLEPSMPKESSKKLSLRVILKSGEVLIVEESGTTFREVLDKAQSLAVRRIRKLKEKKLTMQKKKVKPTELMQ